MTDSRDVPPTSPTRPTVRRRRRWPWILAIIAMAMLLLIALVPTLLSLGAARRMVLGQANKQINGRINVDSWSLGWFSGVKMKHVTVVDAQSQPVAEVQSVVLPASVPGLLGSNKNLGAIEIENPRANIVLYADGTSNLQRLMKPAQQHVEEKEKKAQPLGFDVHGQILVRNGEVTVQQADSKAQPFLLRDLNTEVKIDSLSKPIAFDLKAALGADRAPLTVNGTALVTRNNVIDPNAIEADVKVAMSAFDLAGLSSLLPAQGTPLQVGGRMDFNLTAQMRGQQSVQANGAMKIRDLTATGGSLGADRPAFDHVDAAFDVALDGANVRINTFTFDSPVANASASGALTKPEAGKLPTGALTAQARVDLAALAAQLPHTLKLQEGLALQSGLLRLDSKVTSDAQAARAESVIRVENVAGTRNGRPVALEQPIVLTLRAAQTPQGLELENLDLASSFANAKGAGNLEKFNLLFTSDLQAAMREAAKFVDLDGKSAKGQARVELNVTGADPQQKTIRGALRLTGLELAGFTTKPAALQELSATLDAVALLDKNYALQQITGLKIDFKSPLATAAVTADSVVPAAGESLPALKNGRLTLNADLATLSDFAGRIGAMPADTALAGALAFNAPLAADKGLLRLGPMDMVISKLDVTQEKKRLREPEVRMTGLIEAKPATRTAAVRDLVLTLSAGKLEVPRVDVPDWAQAPAGVTAEIKGGFDLARLMAAAGDFVSLPEGAKIAGELVFNLTATGTAETTKAAVVAAINALKITPAKPPVIEDPKIVFETTAVLAAKADTAAVETLKLTSSFANVGAKATLAELSKSKKLDASGTLDLNWDRIAPLVVALSGQPIELSGRQARPFEVHTTLASTDLATLLKQTLASAGIYIARAKVMGIETGVLDIPIRIGSGLANVKVDTTVNDGRLLMPMDINATGKEPVLTLPNDTPFMAQVKISNDMADQFLSRLSPIFKGMVVTGGRVSILSRRLNAPLASDAAKRATFEGDLTLHEIGCRSSGFLKTVLDAAGVNSDQLTLPNQKITVTLREGRLYESPVQIAAAGYSFRIGGSVGLDMTLDMTAELPITPQMLGNRKDIYEYVKGESIRVPIKGTASSPSISRDIIQANVAPLIESAGRKLLEQKGREGIQKGLEDILKKR